MSRDVTSRAKQAIYAQRTSDCFLFLLKLHYTDASGDVDLYFCDNHETVTVDGQEYIGFNFELSAPDDADEALKHINIRMDNVDRSMVEAIRSAIDPAIAEVSIALIPSTEGAPPSPTVEVGPVEFTLRHTKWDAFTLSGSLMDDVMHNECFPGDIMSPSTAPGLFHGKIEQIPDAGEVLEGEIPKLPPRGAPAFTPFRPRIRRR